MIFRVISNQGRKFSAYGLFSAFPDQFTAILEDPSGAGNQFLVSRHGQSASLSQDASPEHVGIFFDNWKSAVAGYEKSPAIRCLFYASYEAGSVIEALPEPKTVVPGPLLWTFYPTFSLCFCGESIHIAAKDEATILAVLLMFDDVERRALLAPASLQLLAKPDVTSAEVYKKAVEQVKEFIAAGDVFQANIARFWSLPFDQLDLLSLYNQLRRVNPAPFSSFVSIGRGRETLTLISASPERLFRIHADGEVDTRPIAGTRRRAEGDEDDTLKSELLLSEKERAEHIMLVDLERNDLGRVCRPGSVDVNERMVIEQYATVQHIVSNVRGTLEEGRDVVDLFKAMFPGGTITGCPKVRCMEIIHDLENNARGPYTGGLGYVAWDGSADMNILIRTFWQYDGNLNWAAGAGIVADSDPEHELIETGHKAEGLLRALLYQNA